MRKERTESYIECDACGVVNDESFGSLSHGWRQVQKYDLCLHCYETFIQEAIEEIGEKKIETNIKKLIKNTVKKNNNLLNIDWNLKF